MNGICNYGMDCLSKNLKYISNLKILNNNCIIVIKDNKIGNERMKIFSNNLQYITELIKLKLFCKIILNR